jgi:muramoyltetrapeptide carboxypeptidase
MGTPYQIDATGRILFLEDIDEAPYRIDRMLTQLRLAGVFKDCAGIVLGDFHKCEAEPGKPSLELEEVFRDALCGSGKPVLMGLAAGHCSPTLTLPLGTMAELDARPESPGLSMLESATR